jgi:hypothetical protein
MEIAQIAERVNRFLIAPKVATGRMIWATRRHENDYARASLHVRTADGAGPRQFGEIVLTATTRRTPPKYSCVLLLRKEPVLRLDVNPERPHTNKLTLEVVRGTHWHPWPCKNAEPDDRKLGYRDWLLAFLDRANTRLQTKYYPPPFGVQPELPFEGLHDA